MGIDGLHPVLKPYLTQVHVSAYSGQRVGCDASSWLHRRAHSQRRALLQAANPLAHAAVRATERYRITFPHCTLSRPRRGAVSCAAELAAGARPWEARGWPAPYVEFALRMVAVLRRSGVVPVVRRDSCVPPGDAPMGVPWVRCSQLVPAHMCLLSLWHQQQLFPATPFTLCSWCLMAGACRPRRRPTRTGGSASRHALRCALWVPCVRPGPRRQGSGLQAGLSGAGWQQQDPHLRRCCLADWLTGCLAVASDGGSTPQQAEAWNPPAGEY